MASSRTSFLHYSYKLKSNVAKVSVVSVANSIQAYVTPTYSQRVYTGTKFSKVSPVNALSSRTFGTWTLLSSVIRLYAAYNVTDLLVYELACWTYGIALTHFLSEWLIFKSTSWSPGLAAPMFVSSGTLAWMLMQKEFYVK